MIFVVLTAFLSSSVNDSFMCRHAFIFYDDYDDQNNKSDIIENSADTEEWKNRIRDDE